MDHLRIILAAVAVLTFTLPIPSVAQTWPTKPVRLIVPFPPGGGTDLIARLLAERLGAALNVSFVVENRPGAGGNVGIDVVVKSAPDGYTIALGTTANLAINPALYPNMPFNPLTDLVAVSLVATQPGVLAAAIDGPLRSIEGIIAAAKARPGAVTMASPGNGTVGHLVGELFATRAGIKLTHVPYKGAAPALTDLIGGHVSIFITSAGGVMSQITAGGRVRALAVSSSKRMAMLPAVPTLAEFGFSGFEASDWKALVAPTGTPGFIVSRIHAEVGRILQSRDVLDRLATEGSEPFSGNSERFAEFLKSETAKWSGLVKSSGARVD